MVLPCSVYGSGFRVYVSAKPRGEREGGGFTFREGRVYVWRVLKVLKTRGEREREEGLRFRR